MGGRGAPAHHSGALALWRVSCRGELNLSRLWLPLIRETAVHCLSAQLTSGLAWLKLAEYLF